LLDKITPVIITFNEEANLHRTLSALDWAAEVLVVDSGSTDGTLSICADHANVRVVRNPFENFAAQCNFALRQEISGAWILSMDADYVLSKELIQELKQLQPPTCVHAYKISFRYMIGGEPLRGSLYPARTCLYRQGSAHYRQDGHAHKVVINGMIESLSNVIFHDDRKPYIRWITAQKKYARQEAKKLRSTPLRQLEFPDLCRRLGIAPILIAPYLMFRKGLIFDGKVGWEYTKQRLIAEVCLLIALLKRPT
jgi:glycosyltransferase involved in cell wall biosynthesis